MRRKKELLLIMLLRRSAPFLVILFPEKCRNIVVTPAVCFEDATVTVGRSKRLVGDRAYDCDPLDDQLAGDDIELIAPHKSNRIKPVTQDGRKLRRYRRRWNIERLFAWLNKFKRILTRWEYGDRRFTGFVHLACSMILLRRYL